MHCAVTPQGALSGSAAGGRTPLGLLDMNPAFVSPAVADDDDGGVTPRGYSEGEPGDDSPLEVRSPHQLAAAARIALLPLPAGRVLTRGPQDDDMSEMDEFSFNRAASGLRAAMAAAGTPLPHGLGATAPPAPRKGSAKGPRVQGGSASASRCRERLAVAARPQMRQRRARTLR